MSDQRRNVGWPLVFASWAIASVSTLGALFFSEVMQLPPCVLCWYQRIAMFPLVPILGLSLWRGDGMARAYALPLVLAGLAGLALAAGFADQSHFTRAFKRRFSVPPSVWHSL